MKNSALLQLGSWGCLRIMAMRVYLSLLACILLVLLPVPVFSGCTCQPFGATQPYFVDTVPHSEGGVIILWSEPREGKLRAQRLDSQGRAMWGNGHPVALFNKPNHIVGWSMLTNYVDEAVAVWDIRPSGDKHYKLYAQRLDGGGNLYWGTDGIRVSDATDSQERPILVNDDSGGVIVVWESLRYASDGQILEKNGLRAQRINSSGERLWTEFGIPVSTQSIISDSSGGLIGVASDGAKSIFCERIDKDGGTLWRVWVTNVADDMEVSYPNLISDNDGGAIIGWLRSTKGTDFRDWAYCLQRVDPNGKLLWQEVTIDEMSHEQDRPLMVPDGLGGVILLRDYGKQAIRIDAAGKIQWSVPIPVAATSYPVHPIQLSAARDSTDILLAWRVAGRIPTEGGEIHVQKLDSYGRFLWGTEGIPVFSPETFKTQTTPLIISDGSGGAIIVALLGRGSHGADSIQAQRIDSDGNLLWGEDGIKLKP